MEHFNINKKLHTDVLEAKYGPIHSEVLRHDDFMRESYLSDENNIARTYALTIFEYDRNNREIRAIDERIKTGGLIGKAFKDFGYEVRKNVTGVDIGKELIDIAKRKFPKAKFLVGNAEDPKILKNEQFDVVTIILAIQNMKDLGAVAKNLGRLVKENGRVVIVLNHPAFRIPQNSGWGTDAQEGSQYRRVDAYMTELEIKIDMNPGKLENKKITMSYHRPLQVYSKAFAKEGFAITKIEEWISHRKSEPGPHAKAEDKARKEIPLFMCLLLKKLG